jgi:hypothetical protein
MDARIDALFKDLEGLDGRNRTAINESVRRLLPRYEQMFRDEVHDRRKDVAAQTCRAMIRARVAEEIANDEGAASFWRIVLDAIDSPVRAPTPRT